MSSGAFLLILVIAVIALMLLIVRLKMHPVISIFLVTFGLALALGQSPIDAINLINKGFGNTLAGIGVVMILGSIIAIGIQDTGAANAIAGFFYRLLRGKHLELGPSLASYVLSIPVFGDITMILMAPIANTIAAREKISMGTMAAWINMGLFITHSMVPPTPGILAVTLTLGADLGLVIFWGIVISVTTFFITWFLLKNIIAREFIAPSRTYQKTGEIDEKDVVAVWKAFLPLLLPVVLIAAASFGKSIFAADSAILAVLNFTGDRVVALTIGAISAIWVATSRIDFVRENVLRMDPGLSPETSTFEMLTNSWVKRALIVAILPLIITGMGGAFGGVLQNSPAAKEMATMLANASIMPLFIPWLIGFLMMLSVGSVTMAQMTAAALILPILPDLGITPVLAVLAIGAGSMGPNHVNNSGFWVMSGFYNLSVRQGLKCLTFPCTTGSFIALAMLIVLHAAGIL